jgi:hypothetical protein
VKIDFQQGFQSVNRLINSRASAAEVIPRNGALDNTQVIEFKAQLSANLENAHELTPPSKAPLLPPQIDLPKAPTASVNQGGVSVKAPTVLSVERLSEPVEEVALKQVSVSVPPGLDSAARAQLTRALPPKSVLSALITQQGIETGIDPALGVAVATAESSLNPLAVSSDGHASKGLFQLLDRTGAELHSQAGGKPEGYDPFHPELNVKLGLNYLRKLHEYFSAPTEIAGIGTTVPAANSSSLEKLAVAAFNAGEGRVTSAQQRAARQGLDPARYEQVSRFLPDSTQSYVERVIDLKGELSGENSGSDGS